MIKKLLLIMVMSTIGLTLMGAGKRPATKAITEPPRPQVTQVVKPTMGKTDQPIILNQAERSLAKAQDNINFLHAKFKLVVMDHVTKKIQLQASGQVWLANNRRYRVQYELPEKQVLVSNGKQRWLFLPKLNQVQLQALPPEGSPTEFFLELGGGLTRILKTCHAQFKRSDNQDVYYLKPRQPDEAQFKEAKIWTKGQEKLPVKLEVTASRHITVTFEHLKIKLDKQQMSSDELGQFEFEVPKDAELIEMFWPMK